MTAKFDAIEKIFALSDNGRPMTALSADVVVYLDQPLNAFAAPLNAAIDAFLALVPAERLTWYGTDSTTKDRPCTTRALAIPKTWYRPGCPPKEHRALSVHDGDAYNAVARCGLRISSYELQEDEERLWEPSVVRFMLPASEVWADPAPLRALAQQLADSLPIVSGHAGYCVERNFAYYYQPSLRTAYPLAMRFQGADLDDRVWDLQFTHLKTVNWLTLVGDPLLDRAGGRAAVKARVQDRNVVIHEAKHGLLLQAGDKPALGDVNRGERLSEYRAVYQALADLFAPRHEPALKLTIPEDSSVNEEKTEAWYRRFARDIPQSGEST